MENKTAAELAEMVSPLFGYALDARDPDVEKAERALEELRKRASEWGAERVVPKAAQ